MRRARTSRYSRSTVEPRITPWPPWICTARSTTRWAISVAASLATAPSRAIDSAPRRSSQAALRTSSRAASISTCISARAIFVAWKSESVRPNCRRACAWRSASSKARAARPQAAAPTLGRNCSRVASREREAAALLAQQQRRRVAEAHLAERVRGDRLQHLHRDARGLGVDQEHRQPGLRGALAGAREHACRGPRCRRSRCSVLTPVSRHSAPSRSARVRTPPRSEPASGSVTANAASTWPPAIGGSQVLRWISVPARRSGTSPGPASRRPCRRATRSTPDSRAPRRASAGP